MPCVQIRLPNMGTSSTKPYQIPLIHPTVVHQEDILELCPHYQHSIPYRIECSMTMPHLYMYKIISSHVPKSSWGRHSKAIVPHAWFVSHQTVDQTPDQMCMRCLLLWMPILPKILLWKASLLPRQSDQIYQAVDVPNAVQLSPSPKPGRTRISCNKSLTLLAPVCQGSTSHTNLR